ncbi:MAG: sulfate adenylyltransferase [Desulfobacteraceae bacterium]|jgi:sulfate adenylyltransferase|nr:sulfate adenylyltransferase [Desulfobacteraceae bacterium]
MSSLVPPHGGNLVSRLVEGEELVEAQRRARELPMVRMTSRETSDLIMIGIGAFSPVDGFMGRKDWERVCKEFKTAKGIFWPIPITLSVSTDSASGLREGGEVALVDGESGVLMGSMRIEEKYTIDKPYECKQIFRTDDPKHPGVAKVLAQGEFNIAGPVQVLSELDYRDQFPDLYARPEDTRAIFDERGWQTIAALQLRNPMHRSHEYVAKTALEVSDGLFVHQLVGKLKEGDIPAQTRVQCVQVVIDHYFPKERVVTKVYPMEMRYAGPREALLHAVFRQNYGASHMIIGRDHAGVGDYYGPFDAQKIFYDIPEDALAIEMLPIDWTFYCYKCKGMASFKTCPHGKEDHLLLSGTLLRTMLTHADPIPEEFSRPEVLTILKEYYSGLKEKVATS